MTDLQSTNLLVFGKKMHETAACINIFITTRYNAIPPVLGERHLVIILLSFSWHRQRNRRQTSSAAQHSGGTLYHGLDQRQRGNLFGVYLFICCNKGFRPTKPWFTIIFLYLYRYRNSVHLIYHPSYELGKSTPVPPVFSIIYIELKVALNNVDSKGVKYFKSDYFNHLNFTID